MHTRIFQEKRRKENVFRESVCSRERKFGLLAKTAEGGFHGRSKGEETEEINTISLTLFFFHFLIICISKRRDEMVIYVLGKEGGPQA